jgi:hypothetical protein
VRASINRYKSTNHEVHIHQNELPLIIDLVSPCPNELEVWTILMKEVEEAIHNDCQLELIREP